MGLLNTAAPKYVSLSQQEENLLNSKPEIQQQLESKYPFAKNYDLSVKVSPGKQSYYAETYGPNEEGGPSNPRPQEFPIHGIGVEIYKPDKFSAEDLAGELLHVDPVANKVRELLQGTFSSRQLEILKQQGDYQYPQSPTKDAAQISGQQRFNNATDALIRGYVVGQWPKEALKDFGLNKDQMNLLNYLKNYIETGNE